MENNSMTPEMINKAKAAKSEEELIAIAKGYGVDLNPQEAQELFAKLQKYENGELNDEELDDVSGGIWLFWRK